MVELVMLIIITILTYLLIWLILTSYWAGKWGKNKKDYAERQIGGTCGFYAMAFVYKQFASDNTDSIQHLCTQTIPKMIDAGYSYVGEIFTAERFVDIWNKSFAEKLPNAKCTIVNLQNGSSIETIKTDLGINNNGKCYYIVPSRSTIGTCPHYYVVWQEENNIFSWDGCHRKQTCELDSLLNEQKNMVKEFKLLKYFRRHTFLWGLFGWDERMRNKTLFKYLLEKEITVKKDIPKELLNILVNLEGYCIRIGV